MTSHRFACIAFGMLVSSSAFANSDSDLVAKETVRAAAETYARQEFTKVMNEAVATWTAGSIATAGTSAFALVDLGRAIDDLSDARTPEQRINAGARAAVAVYALAGGPAAPVIALGLALRQVMHAAEDAKFAKELAAIYKRREEHLKRVLEVRRELATADYYWLAGLYLKVVGLGKSLQIEPQYIKEHCMTASAVRSADQLDKCLTTHVRIVSALEGFVAVGEALLTFNGSGLSANQLLRSDELSDDENKKRPFELTRQALEKAIATYRDVLQQQRQILDDVLRAYQEASSQLLLREAYDQPLMDEVTLQVNMCLNQTLSANSSAAASLAAWSAFPSEMQSSQFARGALAEPLATLMRLRALPCAALTRAAAPEQATALTRAISQTDQLIVDMVQVFRP